MQLFHVLPILQEGEGFYDNSTAAVALFARQVECPNPIFFLWMTQNLCPDSRRSLARSSHEKHSLTQVARALPNVVVRTVQTIILLNMINHFHCLIKESICKGQINLGQHFLGMMQGLKTWRGAYSLPTSLQLVGYKDATKCYYSKWMRCSVIHCFHPSSIPEKKRNLI